MKSLLEYISCNEKSLSLDKYISEACKKITITNDNEYKTSLSEWRKLKNASMNHKLTQRDANLMYNLNKALDEYEEKNNIERKF